MSSLAQRHHWVVILISIKLVSVIARSVSDVAIQRWGTFNAQPIIIGYDDATTRRQLLLMSKADIIFKQNCRDIIDNGVWDTNFPVRPKWEDGTPAHTVKKFCIVNRYNLAEEFPIMTIRKTNFAAAIDEILWIWQKKEQPRCRSQQPYLGFMLRRGRHDRQGLWLSVGS